MVSDEITQQYESLSKTHKLIANYVLKHQTETSYFSIKELSEVTGAGEATIIRFCIKVGYAGYPEFKAALRNELAEKGSITDRLRRSYKVYEGRGAGIVQMLQDDIGRIEKTISNLDMNMFFEVCEKIILAKKIYILASRSAASLGIFFQYYLNMALGNVELISDMGCTADQLCELNSNDVVIGITFIRYTRSTVDLFQYAKEQGAQTIAITDSPVSPLIRWADKYLLTDTSMPSYLDSFVAPLALINAILAEIGRNKNVELEKRITDLDNFYKKHDIF